MRQIITNTDFEPRIGQSRVAPVPEILLNPGIVSTPDLERMLALQASLDTVSMLDTKATSRVLKNRFEIFYLEKAILRDLERIEKATKALHRLEQKMEQSVGDSSRERELWRKFELVCEFIDYSWMSASNSNSDQIKECANERQNIHKSVESKIDLKNAKIRYQQSFDKQRENLAECLNYLSTFLKEASGNIFISKGQQKLLDKISEQVKDLAKIKTNYQHEASAVILIQRCQAAQKIVQNAIYHWFDSAENKGVTLSPQIRLTTPIAERDLAIYQAMRDDQIAKVIEIARLSFIRPWSGDTWQGIFNNPKFKCLAAKLSVSGAQSINARHVAKDEALGYIVYHESDERLAILNIAVHPDVRRLGIARHLIEDAIRQAGGRLVVGFVSEANPSAAKLFAGMNFEVSETDRKDRSGKLIYRYDYKPEIKYIG